MKLLLSLLLTFIACSDLATASVDANPSSVIVTRKVAARQMTRQKIVNRSRLQRALLERPDKVRQHAARASVAAKVYPKCDTASVAGYARFFHYDYLGDDVAGGATTESTEAVCLEACNADSNCQGTFFWFNGQSRPCYKKTTNTHASILTNTNAPSTNGVVDLKGSCSSLEAFYSADQMSTCCDTFDAYPTCEVASQPGYARFANWDYVGQDIANNPRSSTSESACITLCKNYGAGCLGTFYWPNNQACYLKSSNNVNSAFSSTTTAATSTGAETSLQGTCNLAAANGITTALSSCCNTRF